MNEPTNGNMWEGNFSLGDPINYSNLCRNFLYECSSFSDFKIFVFCLEFKHLEGSESHLLFKRDFHLSLLNHRDDCLLLFSVEEVVGRLTIDATKITSS